MKLDRESLRAETDKMIQSIGDPAFLQVLEKVRQAPKEERLDVAAKLLTPEAMRSKGIDLPEWVRLSSRVFENDVTMGAISSSEWVGDDVTFTNYVNQNNFGLPSPLPDPYWSVCACLGVGGVCAGVGGGP